MSRASVDTPLVRDVVLPTAAPVVTVDEAGKIVYASAPLEEALGWRPDDVIGDDISLLFPDDPAVSYESIVDRTTPDAAPVRLSGGLIDASGSEVTVDMSVDATEREGVAYRTMTLLVAGVGSGPDQRQEETDRLVRQLFDHRMEALLVADVEADEFVNGNRQACELLGVEPDDLSSLAPRELPADDGELEQMLQDVLASGQGRRTESVWQPPTRDRLPVEVTASPIEVGGRRLVLVAVREVAERRQLEREHGHRTTALEVVWDAVAILDADHTHTYLNDAYAELYGYDEPEVLLGEPWETLAERPTVREEVLPAVRDQGHWQGGLPGRRADGSTFHNKVRVVELTDDHLVIVADTAEETRDDERDPVDTGRLEAMEDATRALLDAEDTETVARIATEVATEVLKSDVGCLRLFDEDENALEVAAMTDAARALVAANTAFELEVSAAGRAYRIGEPVVRASDGDGMASETPVGPSMHLPLGDHGTLTVAGQESEPFDDADRYYAGMLATVAETALDWQDQATTFRERETALCDQRDRLEAAASSGTAVRELLREVFAADSKTAIIEVVCAGLADLEPFEGAWLGELDAAGEELTATTGVGVDEAYLDLIDDLSLASVEDGIVQRALSTGEVATTTTVSTIPGDVGEAGDPGSTADSSGSDERVVAAVPVAHTDRQYGALVVEVADRELFDYAGREHLALLGDAVGFAFDAIQNRELLLSDERVQLEFEVTDKDCLTVALSDELDTRCEMQRTVKSADGTYLSYAVVQDSSPEAVREAAEELESVVDYRVVSERPDGCLLEVSREETGAEVMMEFGATAQTATAENGHGTLVIEAPGSVDVRTVVDAYTAYNPDSELVAKRDIDEPVRTAAEFRETIEGRLTDRQRAAINAAYFSGYYEWPRESNAEEIAAAMGISASTLHQHLRKSHEKLLSAILDE